MAAFKPNDFLHSPSSNNCYEDKGKHVLFGDREVNTERLLGNQVDFNTTCAPVGMISGRLPTGGERLGSII
jgi:hypothetical protein